MRKETVEARTKKEAESMIPWACVIVRVEGGYRGWESQDEYEIWKNQK